jgi:hypothetical protein
MVFEGVATGLREGAIPERTRRGAAACEDVPASVKA